jgi:hypothetical protein
MVASASPGERFAHYFLSQPHQSGANWGWLHQRLFSPIHGPGDSIDGTVTFTTYQPDGAGGTILNGVECNGQC